MDVIDIVKKHIIGPNNVNLDEIHFSNKKSWAAREHDDAVDRLSDSYTTEITVSLSYMMSEVNNSLQKKFKSRINKRFVRQEVVSALEKIGYKRKEMIDES